MEYIHNPGPYFDFPELPPFGKFSFEPLTTDNAAQLYLLFEDDNSPFTDERFRTYDGVMEYAGAQERWGRFSPKHGGQDWFFKRGDEYIGILHLYDLSLETWNDNHRRCWIGFGIKPAHRQKGIAKEVVTHFIASIWTLFPHMQYIHCMTDPQNFPSKALMLSLGFRQDDTERLSDRYCFFLLERPVAA